MIVLDDITGTEDCVFCRLVHGEDLPQNYSKQADVILRTEHVTAFVSSHWWPENPGHVLIVPNQHVPNLYELPFELGGHILAAARSTALAFKAVYRCAGVSTRQHNEPAGNQEIFHYHLHVFPRYWGDELYLKTYERRATTPEERQPYAERLRAYLNKRGA